MLPHFIAFGPMGRFAQSVGIWGILSVASAGLNFCELFNDRTEPLRLQNRAAPHLGLPGCPASWVVGSARDGGKLCFHLNICDICGSFWCPIRLFVVGGFVYHIFNVYTLTPTKVQAFRSGIISKTNMPVRYALVWGAGVLLTRTYRTLGCNVNPGLINP